MLTAIAPLPNAEWSYVEILIRLALALVLGLLMGLERERRGKEAGLRTFGFVALLSAPGGSLGEDYAIVSLVLAGLLSTAEHSDTSNRRRHRADDIGRHAGGLHGRRCLPPRAHRRARGGRCTSRA
jgi:hypothetical protein